MAKKLHQKIKYYNFYTVDMPKYTNLNPLIVITQIDFKTQMLCSIEKGIIKRQLPFSTVKSCDDGVGSRFSISFKGHHDYELEATSLEDKHKVNLYLEWLHLNYKNKPAH